MHQRRVVITGLGAMTPLGCSVGEYWDGLIHGRSGIDRIKNFDASELPCQIAGEVPEFDPNDFMDRKSARRMPHVAQLAMGAARQAIADAALSDPVPEAERTGVFFGTAVGGIERVDISGEISQAQGLQPYCHRPTCPAASPTYGFLVAQNFRCLKPDGPTTTACAAGTPGGGSGGGADSIRRGAPDLVIAGAPDTIRWSISTLAAIHASHRFRRSPRKPARSFRCPCARDVLLGEVPAALVLKTSWSTPGSAHTYLRQ